MLSHCEGGAWGSGGCPKSATMIAVPGGCAGILKGLDLPIATKKPDLILKHISRFQSIFVTDLLLSLDLSRTDSCGKLADGCLLLMGDLTTCFLSTGLQAQHDGNSTCPRRWVGQFMRPEEAN